MNNLLLTGTAGFIGSNFVEYLFAQERSCKLINLDKLTYAGSRENLKEFQDNPNFVFVEGDICDRKLVESLFNEYKIDGVINFAAESHVDNSIETPDLFMQTNVMGTFNLLDISRKFWMNEPFITKEDFSHSRFLHISTDEVYGELEDTGLFTEKTAYAPNSPYSASKASSDMIVRAYNKTYGLNTVITNCSNNYGPSQHDEKLIPTIIRKAINGESIPIYGDGKNVRDWLYVADHCRGIDLAFNNGKSGETYNIGGRNEKNNLEVLNAICSILDRVRPKENGSYLDQLKFVKDRPGHDKRYAIDASKIETELGWTAEENFETGIEKTVAWYLKSMNPENKKTISILIPVFNEELNIKVLYEKLEQVTVEHISKYSFEYLFVDDGSEDNSAKILEELAKSDNKLKLLELSRNFGKEIALTAGIQEVDSDGLIIMDSDLQHPPAIISDLIKKWEEGFEIVATKRTSFENRGIIKKLGSKLFYKLINRLSETEMVSGTTDFRLLDSVIVEHLKKFTERNRLVRGLVDWMGFKKTYVEFEAPDRIHGEASYTLIKLFRLAINSFTSFSLFPLKIAGYFGVLISSTSGSLLIWMLIDKYVLTRNHFTSISYVIVANTFFMGVILMALGMIALYIGFIHTEVTNRPLFLIRNKINLE